MLRSDIDDFILTIPKNVNIVCATKYASVSDLKCLLAHNLNSFGENRVEPFLEKYEALKDENITWSFIGHLQCNKADLIINKIDCLHSLSSLKLAKIIEKNRTSPLDCFIEVSINLEESKDGVPYYEVEEFMKEIIKYKKINPIGYMMMSKKDSTKEEKLEQFLKLKKLKDEINQKLGLNIECLSMGMSDDYLEAIKASSTHIRLGRILWTQ